MPWIKANYGKVLFGVAVLCMVIAVGQYFQMVAYNNCGPANWMIVLAWSGVSFGLAMVAAATNLPAFQFSEQFDTTSLPGSAPSVKSPTLRNSSTDIVAQVAALRQRADSAHKSGDDLNAAAADLVAKRDAEVTAAKKLLEGAK